MSTFPRNSRLFSLTLQPDVTIFRSKYAIGTAYFQIAGRGVAGRPRLCVKVIGRFVQYQKSVNQSGKLVLEIVTTERYDHHHDTYQKRKKQALKAVITNLNRFIKLIKILDIDTQASLSSTKLPNYVHREPQNIIAIGQEGRLGHGVTKTRLYTYPDIENNVIYLFCIGGDKRQSEDIQYCLEMLKEYGIEPK